MMSRDEANQIIRAEQLRKYVWFDMPGNAVDSVAIYQDGDRWFVTNTDERAVTGATRQFTNESEALELFIRRLRLSQLL